MTFCHLYNKRSLKFKLKTPKLKSAMECLKEGFWNRYGVYSGISIIMDTQLGRPNNLDEI